MHIGIQPENSVIETDFIGMRFLWIEFFLKPVSILLNSMWNYWSEKVEIQSLQSLLQEV